MLTRILTSNFFDRDNIHNRIFYLSLLLIVVSLPFSIKFNSFFIILLAINWLIEGNFNQKFQTIKTKPLALLIIGFYLFHIVGLLYSDNISSGLHNLEKKLGILVFPLILSTSKPLSKDRFTTVVKVFIYSCMFAGLICFAYAVYRNYQEGYSLTYLFEAVVYEKHNPNLYPYINYWYFTYYFFTSIIHIHPIYFSMYMVLSVCITIWLWYGEKKTGKNVNKGLLIFYLAFQVLNIILLSARMPILAFTLIFTVGIIYYFYHRNYLIKGVLIVIGYLLCICALIYTNPITRSRFDETIDFKSDYKSNKWGGRSLRFHKWQYSFEVIKKNLVLGVGTGDTQDELQKVYSKNNFQVGLINRFNPHNQFIETILTLGIIGGLLLIACFFKCAKIAINQRNYLFLTFIILFVFCSFTESMLETNKGIIFFSVFSSLFAFHFPKSESGRLNEDI